jgi:hypothetical protein
MSSRKSEREIEERSLKDLREILTEAKSWGLKILVIGGYAVRAYTIGYRYTKDIDMVVNKEETGRFSGLLKGLDYKVTRTKFGISGTKKVNGGDIKLHISIGEIYDESTNNRYPINEDTFRNSRMLDVSGFYEREKLKFRISVISIEELLILKLMMKARDKDVVDLIALLTDKMQEIDVKTFAHNCRNAAVDGHIRRQMLNFIGIVRKGDAAKYWFRLTGNKLDGKTQTGIIRFMRTLEESLK